MTEREKIIELAKSTHGCYFPENSKFPPYQFLTIEALESFYRSAQADAFEQAHNAADNAYATDDVLNAIRQLGKEKK